MKNNEESSIKLLKKQLEDAEILARNEEQRAKLNELKEKVERLENLPIRFNQVFATRGWIAYADLSVGLMEHALRLEKLKGINIAENYITEYYDSTITKEYITKLWGVEPFRNRLHLIKLAYEDFICGRYHSCIPLILMMIDGVVADAGDNAGFFAEKSSVTSWDSIAGNDTGLSILKSIFFKSRTNTSKNKINMPYRNGIMHGRDLGYANKEVAAKCWALLFAIRDLLESKRDEKTRREKYEKDKNKTVYDVQNEMKELEDGLLEVIQMDSFKRKSVIVGVDFSQQGVSDDYEINTPERALVEFFDFWKVNNYGKMAMLLFKSDIYTKSQLAGQVSKTFKSKNLTGFEMVSVDDLSSCKTDILTKLNISYNSNNSIEYDITFRLLYCKKDSTELVVNPQKDGMWKIADNFSDINQIGTSLEYL